LPNNLIYRKQNVNILACLSLVVLYAIRCPLFSHACPRSVAKILVAQRRPQKVFIWGPLSGTQNPVRYTLSAVFAFQSKAQLPRHQKRQNLNFFYLFSYNDLSQTAPPKTSKFSRQMRRFALLRGTPALWDAPFAIPSGSFFETL